MYIQEEGGIREQGAPPDYRGHTYKVPERGEFSAPPTDALPDALSSATEEGAACMAQDEPKEESAPVGAFGAHKDASFSKKDGKRGDFLGGLGLSELFSRVPFLSSLAPPPRSCEGARKHSELWDWVLLALVALSLLNGKDDDVLPLLLLLLLWD